MGLSCLNYQNFRFFSYSSTFVAGEPVSLAKDLQRYAVIDIETFDFEGQQVAYAIGGFDGKHYVSRYISSSLTRETLFQSSTDMVSEFLTVFFKTSKARVIYCHNLSYDGHFLLKVLKESFPCRLKIYGSGTELVSVEGYLGNSYSPEILYGLYGKGLVGTKEEILKRVNRNYDAGMPSVNIPDSLKTLCEDRVKLLECFSISAKRSASFVLKDSFKLLPYSLRDLAQVFQVETQKGVFPYRFVTFDTLFYSGNKPAFSYFDGVDFAVYSCMSSFFDLKVSTLEYLEKDCKCLYEVLFKFQQFICEKSGVDSAKAFTYSGLSFLIYRHEQILKGGKRIYRLSRGEDLELRRAYFGGSTEVFKPYFKGKLYYYDINSLYPASMLKPMPIGRPRFVEVDKLDSFFGFVKCVVNVPSTLRYPVLPSRFGGQIYQYMATGRLRGMWFSEELKYAISLGCVIEKFEGGFAFDQGDLFSEFVTKYFEIKAYGESIFHRKIAKLLLNSLYGKMGQKFMDICQEVVYEDQYAELEDKHKILTARKVGIGGPLDKVMVRYIPLPLEGDAAFPNLPVGPALASVAISAAISAYSRIRQYQIIEENFDSIYYTDTDSFITDKPIIEHLGNGLGELRLEGMFDEGYFLAPKIYGLRRDDGGVKFSLSGIEKKLLRFEDYERLYRSESLFYDTKRITQFNSIVYEKEARIFLSGDFSLKRERVFDCEGRWIDTKPYDSSKLH